MSSIKTTQIDGDISVGRNVAMGGKAEVAGNLTVGHTLLVKGWLDAPNIKGANKGVFITLDELEEAYPEPHAGWYAGVGTSSPFDLYVGRDGGWSSTGGTMTIDTDLTIFENILEEVLSNRGLSGFVVKQSINDLPSVPDIPSLGYLVDGHLYVFVGTGGDTLDGLYQDCGEIRGPQGPVGPQGHDGVVLDPEAVTIFNDPSDLEGKTDEEKALMIPNGLAYEQGGGGDTTALTNAVAQILADKDRGSTLSNSYIRSSNSQETSSPNTRTWKVTVSGNYTRMVAHVRNDDTGAYSVSFFSSSVISAATKIASYVHSATDWDDYDLPIPEGTALICVTTRKTYESASYFRVYGLVDGVVQQLDDRVTSLESAKAVEPFALMYFVGGMGWSNTPAWSSYGNLIGDPYKHELAPYLIDGKLVIINNYTGTNQVKCKIPWFNGAGGGNSFNAWTVLQQGENVFTPRANSVYFSICLGMNDSGGTEINASDVSMYEGFLFYKLANTNPQQITANIGSIQSIEHRLDVMDNFGNPLQVGGDALVYDKIYYGRPLKLGKRYNKRYTCYSFGNQGGAEYNDLLFTFNADHKNCYVIDMQTKALVQNIALTQETNFHCNCVNFGIEKADAADEFPLLYVDGYYTKTCYVYRITGDRGSFMLTKMQTITYPSTWNHPEMFIDRDAETMWVLDDQANNVTFKRMAIPALSAGDVTLSADNVLDEVNIGATPVTQAGSIFNGDLYFGAGYTGEGIVYVIDLYAERRIVTKIYLGTEPQTPFVWNGNLYVLESGTLDILYLT